MWGGYLKLSGPLKGFNKVVSDASLGEFFFGRTLSVEWLVCRPEFCLYCVSGTTDCRISLAVTRECALRTDPRSSTVNGQPSATAAWWWIITITAAFMRLQLWDEHAWSLTQIAPLTLAASCPSCGLAPSLAVSYILLILSIALNQANAIFFQ